MLDGWQVESEALLPLSVHDSSYPTLLPNPIAQQQQLSRAVAMATAKRATLSPAGRALAVWWSCVCESPR